MGGISLDTETTGLDLYHGAEPFLVTICYEEDMSNSTWKWDVDPETRKVLPDEDDLIEIQREVDEADYIVMQNAKFDIRAIQNVYRNTFCLDWRKLYDTQLSGHLLHSDRFLSLTIMALMWLDEDLQPFEDAVEKATKRACTYVKTNHPTWRIAGVDLPEMPSAKEKTWKFDMWLMDALRWDEEAKTLDEYANSDSTSTLALHLKHIEAIKQRGLEKIYSERLKLLPIVCSMEDSGISLSGSRLNKLLKQYHKESQEAEKKCVSIAKQCGLELNLPKSGNNKSLLDFTFHNPKGLQLKTAKKTKKGNASLDSDALDMYVASLSPDSDAYQFITPLQGKRKRDTAISYMESYKKYWLDEKARGWWGWYRLHPTLKPTGTSTLRWSSSNPNEQNISKKEGFNLRYAFGPLPNREWWAMDAQNIELRIPAYEVEEENMIYLFEHPDDPPYFGSNHLMVFDLLHARRLGLNTKKNPRCLLEAKKKYAATWYQWTKNGNFAVQYGAREKYGTADRAYHLDGAHGIVKQKFSKIHGEGGLNEMLIEQANSRGYVETMPDKTVDPNQGYPIVCSKSAKNHGKVSPTIPLNYHVQGTAMWWMEKAMVRCSDYLRQLNNRSQSGNYSMIMQVHDELVFDFPYKENKGNLPKIRKLKRLMEMGGDDIGVPTPVSIEYHPNNWSESE